MLVLEVVGLAVVVLLGMRALAADEQLGQLRRTAQVQFEQLEDRGNATIFLDTITSPQFKLWNRRHLPEAVAHVQLRDERVLAVVRQYDLDLQRARFQEGEALTYQEMVDWLVRQIRECES